MIQRQCEDETEVCVTDFWGLGGELSKEETRLCDFQLELFLPLTEMGNPEGR